MPRLPVNQCSTRATIKPVQVKVKGAAKTTTWASVEPADRPIAQVVATATLFGGGTDIFLARSALCRIAHRTVGHEGVDGGYSEGQLRLT